MVRAGGSRQDPVRVTAAVIEEKGKVLLARRGPGRHLAGKWEFPGGKIEPGETPEQSLERELEEELAIRTRVGELLCSTSFEHDGISLELLVYRVERTAGEPQLREHLELAWVPPQEVASYDLADSDRTVARALYG